MIIFQCAQCRVVLTDSNYLVDMNEDRKTVAFSAGSSITTSDKIMVSRNGDDLGSTYKSLSCKTCQAALGKKYITTPPHLDAVRSHLCFDVGSVLSYEVGRLDVKEQPNPMGMLQRLRLRQGQLMQMCLQFERRIRKLEADAVQGDGEGDAT